MSLLDGHPRYLALAQARQALLSDATRRIPAANMASQARALRLWNGKAPVVRNEGQLGLLYDLAVFAPVGGHTPALERTLRGLSGEPGSAAEAVLAALPAAVFTLFRIEDAAPEGGVIAQDILSNARFILWDRFLEREDLRGVGFGGRLMAIDGIYMTCGTTCPLTDELLQAMLGFPAPEAPPPAMLPPLSPPTPEDVALLREAMRAPDFVPRLYRTALDLGLFGPRPDRP
ncbi:MAG: hypothetical protein RMK64_10385 [Rhodovarius sp.]|nr:hypothetical protein [Rhodovarius sp.]MCX7931381.1 hypothetical protein [Rhodovarius sp.]MDW8315367.1 hypothetical protein [Rhodovarius sp.]